MEGETQIYFCREQSQNTEHETSETKQNDQVGLKIASPTVHRLVLCIYLSSRVRSNQRKQTGSSFAVPLSRCRKAYTLRAEQLIFGLAIIGRTEIPRVGYCF